MYELLIKFGDNSISCDKRGSFQECSQCVGNVLSAVKSTKQSVYVTIYNSTRNLNWDTIPNNEWVLMASQ